MIHPDEKLYLRLAADYDVIPVVREILADRETPVSVLEKFSDNENAFLLESMEGGETWGRYSFVGVNPELLLEVDHATANEAVLQNLRNMFAKLRVAGMPGLPRFFGGAVGYLAYEAIGSFEKMPAPKASDDPGRIKSRFMRVDRLVVFDNVRHTIKIVVCSRPGEAASPLVAYRNAVAAIDDIMRTLRRPVDQVAPPPTAAGIEFRSNMDRNYFSEIVRRARDYIVAGDVIQVVLSQRFTAECNLAAVDLYRALRFLNPSPYTFFIKTGNRVLVGSSPEVMVRLTGNRVELRPIAGTRPRGATEQEDRALASELLSDEKERAEHVMLVDLGRNDVGRVAEAGSVQVTEYMVIERYSHVMHMVSHVEGILRREFDACDVIASTFPAGTLSGAPKIRAMEIIHELEPEPRGAYGGAAGYIGYDGNMDLAITIRTLEVTDGKVAVQAGAGIVYDSDPEREYQETCHKARGMQRAVELAAAGLDIDILHPANENQTK